MPGVASIKWADANMAQALHALIYYGAVKVDDEVAQKVADHLGGGCTTTAIHNLIRTRKSSFKPGVTTAVPTLAADNGEGNTAAPKRKRKKAATETTATKAPKKKARTKATTKKAVVEKEVSDVENDDDDEEVLNEGDFGLTTPPSSGHKQSSSFAEKAEEADGEEETEAEEAKEVKEVSEEAAEEAAEASTDEFFDTEAKPEL